jgi:hypothetical protein
MAEESTAALSEIKTSITTLVAQSTKQFTKTAQTRNYQDTHQPWTANETPGRILLLRSLRTRRPEIQMEKASRETLAQIISSLHWLIEINNEEITSKIVI